MSIREDILDQFGEEAFIGLAYRGGGNNNQVAVYGIKSCVRTLKQKNKWSREEAGDYFSYNIETCYSGEYTPIFIEEMRQPSKLIAVRA